MPDPHVNESRCLRRCQYRLLFISSTLSCGILGSEPDTIIYLTQHSCSLDYSFIFVVFVLFFALFLFSMLSLERCRRSSDIYLSSRPRTASATTYNVYYCVWLRLDRLI